MKYINIFTQIINIISVTLLLQFIALNEKEN